MMIQFSLAKLIFYHKLQLYCNELMQSIEIDWLGVENMRAQKNEHLKDEN